MSSRVKKLLDEALALPPEERALLAAELGSTEGEGPPEEVEAAWREEILHRIRQIERGEVKVYDAEEVYQELLAMLAR